MPKTKGFSIFSTSKFTHCRTVHHYMSVHGIEASEHGHDTRREYNPVHQVRKGNIIWNCILLPLALHLLNSATPLLTALTLQFLHSTGATSSSDSPHHQSFGLPLLLISTSSWFSTEDFLRRFTLFSHHHMSSPSSSTQFNNFHHTAYISQESCTASNTHVQVPGQIFSAELSSQRHQERSHHVHPQTKSRSHIWALD